MRWKSVVALATLVLIAAVLVVSPDRSVRPAASPTSAPASADRFEALRQRALDMVHKRFPPQAPGLVFPPPSPMVPQVPELPNGGYVCPAAGCPDADPCALSVRPRVLPHPGGVVRPSRPGQNCPRLPRKGAGTVALP